MNNNHSKNNSPVNAKAKATTKGEAPQEHGVKGGGGVLINTKLGEGRGKPRIWFEGHHLSKGGLKCGQKLYVTSDKKEGVLYASSEESKDCDFSVNISKRTQNGMVKPLVEIRHALLGELFDAGADLRISLVGGQVIIKKFMDNPVTKARFEKAAGLVSAGETLRIADLFKTLSPEALKARVGEREARSKSKALHGQELSVASLFHGGGTLDRVFHDGLLRAGIQSYVKLVSDIERKFLSASVANNADLWRENTVFIESPIEKISFSERSEFVEIVLAGIPCTGSSQAGRSSNGLWSGAAEDHDTSGLAFVSFCEAVFYLNPCSVQVENVVNYRKTDGYKVICDVLDYLGYDLSEGTVNGADFGALEARERLFLTATSRGLSGFDKDALRSQESSCLNTVSDALVQVDSDDTSWKTWSYLVAKEIRDKKAGKGFSRTVLLGDEIKVPVIKRTNHKGQSDGVFIQHPFDISLSRLPKKEEQAFFKRVPVSVVNGLSETLACEILGQGVIGSAFEAIGYVHGLIFKRLSNALAA